jgi:[CysO sulfur-carrier protein]-S-L-cysteine hydrolase
MRIPAEMIDEIVTHAREEAPNECCGMIGAREDRATSLYRARNAEASPLRYTVHPQDQLRIMGELEERGETLGAIYHSHTGSAAYPSQTDINLAEYWPDPLYLICSVADGTRDVRAFAIRDGRVEEAPLEIEPG